MLKEYIERQKEWSKIIFGDGLRTRGLCEHIRKELKEIESKPNDPFEWIDVIILALDGAWRTGYSASDIVKALEEKQAINFKRSWPSIKGEDEPMEHIRC